MKNEVKIRIAHIEDAKPLLDISAHYVEKTAVTFEYEIPTLCEFENRIRSVQKKYPYLVAQVNEKIVGYTYVSPFKERPAYDWAVETSIYIAEDERRAGIGKMLYEALEKCMSEQHILNLNACISVPDGEDEHLTYDSVRFHEKMGYRMVGEFHKCGYKFDRWYNMVWMEKHLGEHKTNPEKVKRFDEVINTK